MKTYMVVVIVAVILALGVLLYTQRKRIFKEKYMENLTGGEAGILGVPPNYTNLQLPGLKFPSNTCLTIYTDNNPTIIPFVLTTVGSTGMLIDNGKIKFGSAGLYFLNFNLSQYTIRNFDDVKTNSPNMLSSSTQSSINILPSSGVNVYNVYSTYTPYANNGNGNDPENYYGIYKYTCFVQTNQDGYIQLTQSASNSGPFKNSSGGTSYNFNLWNSDSSTRGYIFKIS